MINKPMGYDEATANEGGSFMNLPAGNYVCVIKKAIAGKSSTGAEQLILSFDIAEGEYKDFYTKQYNQRKEAGYDAKWGGVYRQNIGGKSVSFFKGMICAIEKSNQGYTWNWDERTLTGKRFVGQFGREEFIGNDNEPHWNTKCKSIRSIDALPTLEVLKDKPLMNTRALGTDFMDIDTTGEKLPWED